MVERDRKDRSARRLPGRCRPRRDGRREGHLLAGRWPSSAPDCARTRAHAARALQLSVDALPSEGADEDSGAAEDETNEVHMSAESKAVLDDLFAALSQCMLPHWEAEGEDEPEFAVDEHDAADDWHLQGRERKMLPGGSGDIGVLESRVAGMGAPQRAQTATATATATRTRRR